MTVYILIENVDMFYGENSFSMRRDQLRGFNTLQAAINVMRLWKPITVDNVSYKILEDDEFNNGYRRIVYSYWLTDEDDSDGTPMVARANLTVKRVDIE